LSIWRRLRSENLNVIKVVFMISNGLTTLLDAAIKTCVPDFLPRKLWTNTIARCLLRKHIRALFARVENVLLPSLEMLPLLGRLYAWRLVHNFPPRFPPCVKGLYLHEFRDLKRGSSAASSSRCCCKTLVQFLAGGCLVVAWVARWS